MSHKPLFESLVLTVICDDRPGIVARLSHLLEKHGGNWTDSSMLSLAGKFAGILLVQVPAGQSETLVQELQQLQDEGMQVTVHRSSAAEPATGSRQFVLELLGQDRPGIVRDITAILSRHGVNVLELDSSCESASMSGEMLFKARARLLIPHDLNRDILQADLEHLANELMVDIKLQE
ncbi:MAG TPA: ACT domain-containing protein [Xanthomonadales bacterium]|nr:ACT domain-containing protein [Xanthomonadales bacterium]